MSDQGPQIVRTLEGHKDVITGVAFHPNPSALVRRKQSSSKSEHVQIASSSKDGSLMLWNYHSNENVVRAFRLVLISIITKK